MMRSRPVVRSAVLLALVLAFAPAAVRAQAGGASAPDLAALDAYFARALADWQVPGMAVAVVKDGAVVLAKGYGVRSRGKPDPVDAHTLFAIASNTKAFTAAAMAALVDEGKVRWDDPVRQHLPYFQLKDPVATLDMRVRDLLSHRGGLGTFSGDLLWYGTPYSREEVVRRARHLSPRAPLRADYGYSNVMFVAAGEVIAAVAGRSWDAFVRERFFDPLGMADTVTSIRDLAGRTNVATPHGPVGSGAEPFPWYSWDGSAAAAGIISSAADMARWTLLQLGRGTLDGRQYFSDRASRAMWTPQASFTISREAEAATPSTHFRGYGLGWSVRDYRGRFLAGHGGAYDGMYSAVLLVPEERLGVVVLTNAMTGIGDALTMRVADEFLGAPVRDWSAEGLERARRSQDRKRAEADRLAQARVPGTRPSLPLDGYAGTYGGQLYGDARVSVESGGLVLRLLPNPDLVADLTHWHFDTFRLTWRKRFPWFGDGQALFVLDRQGHVADLRLDVPNEDFWFDELDLRRRPDATASQPR